MKIFLDDYRIPLDCVPYMHQRIGKLNPIYLEKWEVVKNYNEFVKLISKAVESENEITHVSFDHDLADEHYAPEDQKHYKEKTGCDCAKWLKEFYKNKNMPLPIIFVHSMNPVGTENIIQVFK